MTTIIIAAIVALYVSTAVLGAETRVFTLADKGEATMSIVIPTNADPSIEAAANDLASCIQRASGAKALALPDGGPIPDSAIHIGKTRFAESCELPIHDLGYDEYIISPQGDNIVIRGRTNQGTTYGVYGFLRDYMGVRWYMPGELWEVVPKADPLVVKVAYTVKKPDFPYRVWQAGWYSPDIAKWCTRNRITTYPLEPLDFPYRTFNHNLNRVFPVSKYGKDHPEYYSEIDGKRFLPASDTDSRGEPCFTNPDVIRITIETIRDYFSENPEASQYSLSVNDNLDFCACPNCSALDLPKRTHRGTAQHSESYFHFVEQVANEIGKSHPGKTLGCLAYWAVELPSRNIKRLPYNVVVELTQDTSQHFDPKYRALDRELFRRWSKVAGRIIQYDYYGLGWLTPRYYPHLLAKNLKWIRQNGTVGTYAEIYPYWATQDPMTYMALELAWDLRKNPDAVLDDYFATLYADAAPIMKEFYSTLERIWMKPRAGKWFQGFLILAGEIAIFDIGAMTTARRLLEQAEAQSSGVVLERVRYIKRYFDFGYLLEAGYDDAMSLKKLPLDSQKDFDQLGAEALRVMQLAKLTEQTYDNTLKADPIYVLSYKPSVDWYPFGIEYKLDPWEQMLVDAVKEQTVRMRAWAKTQAQPDEANAQVDRVLQGLSKIKTRKMVSE